MKKISRRSVLSAVTIASAVVATEAHANQEVDPIQQFIQNPRVAIAARNFGHMTWPRKLRQTRRPAKHPHR
jgi:hypothetical protein